MHGKLEGAQQRSQVAVAASDPHFDGENGLACFCLSAWPVLPHKMWFYGVGGRQDKPLNAAFHNLNLCFVLALSRCRISTSTATWTCYHAYAIVSVLRHHSRDQLNGLVFHATTIRDQRNNPIALYVLVIAATRRTSSTRTSKSTCARLL